MLHPDHRQPLARGLILFGLCVAVLVMAIEVPALHFRLPNAANVALHTFMEIVSVVVCLMVFAIGWATFGRDRGTMVPLVSSVFLGAGILDFFHLLSYTGMPEMFTPSGSGKAIAPFLSARLLVAVALVVLALAPRRPVAPRPLLIALFGGSLALALGVSAVTMFDVRLRTLFFDPKTGLTPLKIGIEYLIIGLNLLAAAGFARRLRAPQPQPTAYLLVSVCLMALSELALTLYETPVDQYSNLGHLFKILAYLLVWHAMFEQAVVRPYVALQHAKNELRLGAERYRLLFENTLSGVLIVEPAAGRIVDANPAACTMLAAPHHEVTEWRLGAAVADGAAAQLLGQLLRESPASRELTIPRADGSSFEAAFSSVRYTTSEGQQLVSFILEDVTERNRARDEVMRLNATLEERVAQRTVQLQAVNRELESFSHSVAHDLRAPLGAIQGFGKALSSELGPGLHDKPRHYLERITSRSNEMADMIDALLALAQVSMSSLEPEQLDLATVATMVTDNLRESEPGRSVELSIEGPLPAYGDRRLLRAAMENLIGNAWKFTMRKPRARIRIGSCRLPKGESAFFVEDNGAGFDMASAGKLFQVFQRLHSGEDFPGTGIGLANVSRIVTLHGGRLWADARAGEGATFYFTLKPAA